jgi:hypothetical protein
MTLGASVSGGKASVAFHGYWNISKHCMRILTYSVNSVDNTFLIE